MTAPNATLCKASYQASVRSQQAYGCTACVGGVQQPHLQCRVIGGKVLEPKQITAQHSRTSSSSKVSSASTNTHSTQTRGYQQDCTMAATLHA